MWTWPRNKKKVRQKTKIGHKTRFSQKSPRPIETSSWVLTLNWLFWPEATYWDIYFAWKVLPVQCALCMRAAKDQEILQVLPGSQLSPLHLLRLVQLVLIQLGGLKLQGELCKGESMCFTGRASCSQTEWKEITRWTNLQTHFHVLWVACFTNCLVTNKSIKAANKTQSCQQSVCDTFVKLFFLSEDWENNRSWKSCTYMDFFVLTYLFL